MGRYRKRIKYLILCFCLVSIPTVCWGISPHLLDGMVLDQGCTLLYEPSVTSDETQYIGRSATGDFRGMIYAPATNQTICKVDIFVTITGTLTSSHDYYCRIFSIDGNDDVDAIIATSDKIDGDSMVNSTWVSANAGFFVFSSGASLSNGTEYAITFFVDTDGNQSDDPEADTDNHPDLNYDNEANVDAISLGRGSWTWDSSIPYVDENISSNDDIQIRIYTE